MNSDKNDIFLSYAQADEAIAKELSQRLTDLELKCFMAAGDIHPGEKWLNRLHGALDNAKSVIILITPRSVESKWIHIEMGAAWIKQIPIFPALQFVRPEDLHGIAAEFQCAKIETDADKQLFIDFIGRQLGGGKKFRMSFDFMKEEVEKAYREMMANQVSPRVVIGSGKGGALCAAAFATKFNCRLKVIDCDLWGVGSERLTVIDPTCLCQNDIANQNILVVEWARKTGDTYNQIVAALKKFENVRITSYALFWTEESPKPPYFGRKSRPGEVPLGPTGEH